MTCEPSVVRPLWPFHGELVRALLAMLRVAPNRKGVEIC